MISMEEIINKLESIISNIFNITIEELRDNRKLRSQQMQEVFYSTSYMLNMEFLSIVYQRFIINTILL
jgi:hypothetical protein